MCTQDTLNRERRTRHVANRKSMRHNKVTSPASTPVAPSSSTVSIGDGVASSSSLFSSSFPSLASWTMSSSSRPCSLSRDSHWHFVRAPCYSRSGSGNSSPEGRCLVADQSHVTKCRHIVCLLLACLAVTASAESASKSQSSYSELSSTLPNLTIVQQHPDYKTTNIPFRESDGNIIDDASEGEQADITLTAATHSSDSFKPSPDHDNGLNEDSIISNHPLQHSQATSSSLYGGKNTAEEESEYFILNIFHRYNNNSNYFLKADLEQLLVNIGLLQALNRSEGIVAATEDGHQPDSSDHHHHHHEINQNATTRDLNNAGIETEHDHHHVETDLQDNVQGGEQQKPSNFEHTQNHQTVTPPAASHGTRQIRSLSSQQHHQHNKCLSKDELLLLFGYDQLKHLNVDEFRSLCPALIDQLDAGYCRHSVDAQGVPDLKKAVLDPSGHQHDHSHDGEDHSHDGEDHNHDGEDHNHDHVHNVEGDTAEQRSGVPIEVWAYALLSVVVISLCSVAGVIVIPNMKRVFYNHILQFLVALAVGAMSGDAMLHLFPHAMLSESHHHHPPNGNTTDNHEKSSHMDGLYKGLVALMGIYSFFFLERLFTLFTSSRSDRRDKKQKPRRRCRQQQHQQKNQAFHMVNSRLENEGGNTPSCAEMVMVVHPNKALRAYADVSHEAYLHRCDESLVQPQSGYSVTTVLSHRDDHGIRENSIMLEGVPNSEMMPWGIGRVPVLDAEIVGVAKDAEPVASTHSHSHSHLAPDFVGPLSSVAMMVIVGDMIHNFCDGLAIGAAYAGNVAGGLSTSVAVFCHELPHEIGDFAVLVRSGLTMRKAVYFNLISSIPCFVGLIIGLLVGNVMSTSSWIFAGVGGMFLYVTLVDLIPEMSSVYTKCDEPWFLHLLLQASGIAVGTTIMLIISIYEGTLLATFS